MGTASSAGDQCGMTEKRAIAELLAALSMGGEIAAGPRALLGEIIAKVTAALRWRFQAADIEDAIAEALLFLAQKPHLYRQEEGSLAGFIYIVARNVAAKRLRQQSSEVPTDPEQLLQTPDRDTALAAETGIEGPSSSHKKQMRRRKRALAQRMKQLPEDQQGILSAFAEASEGVAWATLHARRTGDDPNRVRVSLHRLIAKLRKELGHPGNGH